VEGKILSVEGNVYPLTDMGNAKMYADMFRNMVRYDMVRRSWLAWDGCRWSLKSGQIHTESLSRFVAEEWNKRMQATPFKDEAKLLKSHWQYTCSCKGVWNMLHMAQSEDGLAVTENDLDQWPMLLNCLNGTINLKTGLLREHDPDDLITQVIPINYDDSAECNLWDRCIEDWHPDGAEDGTWDYLQRFSGYSLTGLTNSRCFPIFWGGGKNGKSVFIDTLLRMMGDYATVASRTLLEAGERSEHPTELADLWKKRLVLVSEPKRGTQLKSGLVKSLTGDSEMSARFMRGDLFKFTITHKMVMLTQNLPKVDENSDAIWDRIHKVPWRVRIPVEKQDPNLVEKLRSEWPGILRWAVQGCLKWQEPPGILQPTAKIVRETAGYRSEQEPARKFVESVLILGKGMFLSNTELGRLVTQWNEFADDDILNKKEVADWLKEHDCSSGLRKMQGSTKRGWLGVGVRSE